MKVPCEHCKIQFAILPEDLKFYDLISPVLAGKKFSVPPPRWCPDCRRQRRLSFRNERSLYRRNCDLCRKLIVSRIANEAPYKVYCRDCWWGDNWDGITLGCEYDFRRSFFDQFSELLQRTPQIALVNTNNENSEFANQTVNLKDCYLIFSSADSRECYYGMRVNQDINCVDNLIVENSELAYECCTSQRLYNCAYCYNCSGCTDSRFLFDCVGCRDCLFCYNLRNKSYCIENKQYTKSEYQKKLHKILEGCRSFSELQKYQREFLSQVKSNALHESTRLRSSENCSGNYLYNCKNAYHCFESSEGEDIRYSVLTNFSRNVVDVNNNYEGELIYETCTTGVASYRVLFSVDAWPANTDVLYSWFCPNSSYLFGCANLQRKQFCILNKQYSENDYNQLVGKIIEDMKSRGEWGEFFPPSLSPFCYKDTVAFEHEPLTREEIVIQGFNWFDYDKSPPHTSRTIDTANLPDLIDDVTDDILESAIECQLSRRLFRLVKPELEFYRLHGFPLPRIHPDERHRARMMMVNPRQLWMRNCAICHDSVESVYVPERTEKVVCEKCFLDTVY